MAKLALINSEEKRAKMVAKYAAKRAELFAVINNAQLSDEERMDARLKLQQLPRNASPSRLGGLAVCSESSASAATSCAK